METCGYLSVLLLPLVLTQREEGTRWGRGPVLTRSFHPPLWLPASWCPAIPAAPCPGSAWWGGQGCAGAGGPCPQSSVLGLGPFGPE